MEFRLRTATGQIIIIIITIIIIRGSQQRRCSVLSKFCTVVLPPIVKLDTDGTLQAGNF